MKKRVLCSITLFATIMSSHAFSQNYIFRMPMFGVQSSNNTEPSSDDSACMLDENGQFTVFTAINEKGELLFQEKLDSENLSYRSPIFMVDSVLNSGLSIVDNEVGFKRGDLINTYIQEDSINTELYELYVCGDSIPPAWNEPENPEDVTIEMCYDQYEDEEFKSDTLLSYGRANNPGPVFIFPSYSTMPEPQSDGIIRTQIYIEGQSFRDSVFSGPTSAYIAVHEDGKTVSVKTPWAPLATMISSNTVYQNGIDAFLDDYDVSQGDYVFNDGGADYYSLFITGDKIAKYVEQYYETVKTENYDWCIDNGYSTVRPESDGGEGGEGGGI